MSDISVLPSAARVRALTAPANLRAAGLAEAFLDEPAACCALTIGLDG